MILSRPTLVNHLPTRNSEEPNDPVNFLDPDGLVRWDSVIKGSTAVGAGFTGILAGATLSKTGVGAVLGVPMAIGGATSFGWGMTEFWAGLIDASVEIPPPSLTALGTLAVTGDVELANRNDAMTDMILSCTNANPATKVEAVNLGAQMINSIIQLGVKDENND